MALPEAGKWLETKPIRWAAGVRVRRGAAMEARAGRIPGLKAKRDILAASLSGTQLADMTARPLRTIRHALQRLTATGLLVKERGAGRKNTYTLPFLAR